jgi:DNA-binding MarR family transcriptional regulator
MLRIVQAWLGLPNQLEVVVDNDVLEVQKLYPRIYTACHTEHNKAASSENGLSWRDDSILAHLSDDSLASASKLARHLNVTRATLSEAITNLMDLGYVESKTDPDDERRKLLLLTKKGIQALSNSSVLDYKKVKLALDKLSKEDRRKVIEGLSLLAGATLSARSGRSSASQKPTESSRGYDQ